MTSRHASGLVLSAIALLALFPASPASPIPPIEGVHEPHPPVVIRGDADFRSPLSGVRSGSGTAEDPYVIAHWRFIGGATSILLEDTRSHVIVEDVSADDVTDDGEDDADCLTPTVGLEPSASLPTCAQGLVALLRASNVSIREVRGPLTRTILYARDSYDLSVSDVEVPEVPGIRSPPTGLDLGRTQRVDAARLVLTNLRPAVLDDVANITIRNSTFTLPAEIPISAPFAELRLAGPSEGVSIVGNRFLGVPLSVRAAPYDLFVAHNEFRGWNGHAFDYDVPTADPTRRTDSLSICGNVFDSNGVGLYASGTWDIDVRGNTFTNNGQAAQISRWAGSWHGVFEGNRVEDNDAGLTMGGKTTRIGNNSFTRNGEGHQLNGDASLNWWGATDGPGSTVGNGSGDKLRWFNAASSTATPWLTEPPALSTRCEREPVVPVPIVVNKLSLEFPGPRAFAVRSHFGPGIVSISALADYAIDGWSFAPYGHVSGSYNASDPNYLLGSWRLNSDSRVLAADLSAFGERIEVQAPAIRDDGLSAGSSALPTFGLDCIVILAAFSDPISTTRLTITVRADRVVDPAEFVTIRTSDEVGFATISDFEGERTVIRARDAAASGAEVTLTRMQDGWLNLTSSERMMIAANYGPVQTPSPPPGTFTLESPDHTGEVTRLFDLNATAGDHRFRLRNVDSTDPDAGPLILWADLDARFN